MLIQKDTKRTFSISTLPHGLRALLIQKDTKLHYIAKQQYSSLRALLIQKDTKRWREFPDSQEFESFANSERYKTHRLSVLSHTSFESFANSERYKTNQDVVRLLQCLRALLIQKDTKRVDLDSYICKSLRALLIQKDTKQLT